MRPLLPTPTRNIVKLSIYTLIGTFSIGYSTYSIQLSSKTVSASSHYQHLAFPNQQWKRNPYSIMFQNAKTFGYNISNKVYGPYGKLKWNENNINYAVISLFHTNTLPFINTLIGESNMYKYEYDPITYVLHSKSIKWHCVQCVASEKQILFWDLPSWNIQQQSAEEYIEQFALPLYNGIILVTNTRLRTIDAILYKEIYDSIERLVPNIIYGEPNIHIPVYIVRTEFDYDLEIKLKQTINNYRNENNWFDWFTPQSILTRNEFLNCIGNIIGEIEDETVRKLDSVFYDNYWRIKRELNDKLFMVCCMNWNDRMIMNNEYLRLLKMMSHVCGYKNEMNKLFQFHNGNINQSQLYRYYTTTKWKRRHYIMSSICTTFTAIAIFLCAKFVYHDGLVTQTILETYKNVNE